MIAGVIFAVLLFTALAILKWNDKRKGISSQSLSEEGQFEELLNPGAKKKRFRKMLIVPCVILGLVVVGIISSFVERRLIAKERAELAHLQQIFPENGTQKAFVKWDKTRVLDFASPDLSQDVYLRIFDRESHKLVCEAFVEKGKNFLLEIGDGEYFVVYARGTGPWYGMERKWGRSTSYGKWVGYLEVAESSGHRWNRTKNNRYSTTIATESDFNMHLR